MLSVIGEQMYSVHEMKKNEFQRKSEQARIPHTQTLLENAAHNE